MSKLWFFAAFFICVNSVSSQSKKEKKEQEQEKRYKEMAALVEKREIEFEAEWASAQQGARINLIGNPNHVRIIGDSISVYLPYFGVRTGGGGAYGGGGGIKIENKIEDLEIEYDDKKRKINLKFKAFDGTENVEFYMSIFAGGNTNINAFSNTRSNISYDGRSELYKKEEKEGKEEKQDNE